MKEKTDSYNRLEAALVKHDDKAIAISISHGERVRNSQFLTEVENIHSADIRYLMMKYGIEDSIRGTVESDLAKLGKRFDCTEALMLLKTQEFKEMPMAPDFKDAIVNRDVRAIEHCIDNNDKITEIFFVLSVMPNYYYSDNLLLQLFKMAMDRKSRCFFLMKLMERMSQSSDPLLCGRLKYMYTHLLYVICETPNYELEEAVASADSNMIIYKIADGNMLHDPAVLRKPNFFKHATIQAAMFLFEIGMTRNDRKQAIANLKKAAARSKQTWYTEEAEILENSLVPFPETVSPRERQLEKAILRADDREVMDLIESGVSLQRPDAMVAPAFTMLAVRTMIAVATRGVGLRVLPHVFRHINLLIACTELSEAEYAARIMVANLVLQVATRNLTWEKDQNRKVLYPMREEAPADLSVEKKDSDISDNNAADSLEEDYSADEETEESKPTHWDNSPQELAEMYNAEILNLKCPKCGEDVEAAAFQMVDFAETPELRNKLPAMFGIRCEKCGYKWDITYPMICRDATTRCTIRVCASVREAEDFRFSAAEMESAALKGDYRFRTVVGWCGALEKLNIFESGLTDFAIGYLKKIIFDKERPDEIYFEGQENAQMFFYLLYHDRKNTRIRVPRNVYDEACDFVRETHLQKKHRNHFVDMNLMNNIELGGESNGK